MSDICPHGFYYWENDCLVCTTDPEDAPEVMAPEPPNNGFGKTCRHQGCIDSCEHPTARGFL